MTPTPAQVEAAKAIYRAHCIRHGQRFDWEQSARHMWLGYAKAALTAAGEDGWTREDAETQKELFREAEAATIERCAQVADDFVDKFYTSREQNAAEKIAAAIRELKD